MILIIKLLRKIGLLKYVNLSINCNKGFIIPIIGGLGIDLLDNSEIWMDNILSKLSVYYKDKAFIDVGVNVGQTLLKVLSINRSQIYFGFEPNPTCVHYLYSLVDANQFNIPIIYPSALSENAGIIDLIFYSDRTADSSASIVQDFRHSPIGRRKVSVTNVKGEVFGEVGMIKIDVEGAELDVLKALEEVIERNRPLISCEILPPYNKENLARVSRQVEIEKLLIKANFGIIRLLENGSYEEISRFGIYDDLSLSNYLFFPLESKIEIFEKLNG